MRTSEKKTQTINILSVVNRATQAIKKVVSSHSLADWASALRKVTEAYNDRSHSTLMMSAPDEVKDSKLLQYQLAKNSGAAAKHNNQKWRARVDRLQESQAFRQSLQYILFGRLLR